MEEKTKKKVSAVAIATAVILVLAGTMAYLADASGTLKNVMDTKHLEVFITEDKIEGDDGEAGYTIVPGTADEKNPTISVVTDTDVYAFAIVKDTLNSHGVTYADYDIADGWVLLKDAGESTGWSSKDIDKFVKLYENQGKTTGNAEGKMTVDPTDPNTKIYYRVIHGNGDPVSYNVIKDNQISYPSTLTTAELAALDEIANKDDKALIFQTYAIQMVPFCPEDEVAAADPATDEQKGYAKDAWNQAGKVEKITVTAAGAATEVEKNQTLQMSASVEPSTAKDKSFTWSVEAGTGTASITQKGVLKGLTAGTVKVVATANDGSGVKGTYEVTVTEPAPADTVSYAVQLYSIDGDTANFGPAVSNVTATSHQHAADHSCIHNATWAEIKANPAAFAACIDAGCTKSIELDTTKSIFANGAAQMTTTGDGVGVLYDELNSSARVWNSVYDSSFSGKYAEAGIQNTLRTLLTAFPQDLQNAISEKTITYKVNGTGNTMSTKLYLLSEDEHKSNSVAYSRGDGTGRAGNWWLRDSGSGGSYWCARCVGGGGGVSDGGVYSVSIGVAPGFSISK